jgi:hypothetical protein
MTINPFKFYSIHELLKAFVLFLIVTLLPIIAVVIAGVQTLLFMLPQSLLVVSIMNLVIILILAFGLRLFIETLSNYHEEASFNTKRFFIISSISLSLIVLFISYLITGLMIF